MKDTIKRKILVVDDNMPFINLLHKYLSGRGYAVEVCFDGISCIKRAGDFMPDLVLVDYSLPGFTGEKVIAALNGNATTSDIPILMLTGSSLDPWVLDTINKCANFRGLMLKPPDLAQLADEIIKAIS